MFLGAVAYGMYWGGSHVIRALGTADVHGHSVDPQAYTCNQLHSDLDEKSGAGRDRFNSFVDAVVQQANVEQSRETAVQTLILYLGIACTNAKNPDFRPFGKAVTAVRENAPLLPGG